MYIHFLFNPDGSLKQRYAPVVSYQKQTDSFVLKYSIPGHHSPRQYFFFKEIPATFPNNFISEIFRLFSITESFLFRHPKSKVPTPRYSIINSELHISYNPKPISQENIDIALYNMNLAITLGKQHHSLFFFDSYLENYKLIHPEIRFTKNVVKKLQRDFNLLISR